MKKVIFALAVLASSQANAYMDVPDLVCKVYDNVDPSKVNMRSSTKENFEDKKETETSYVYFHEDKQNGIEVQITVDKNTLRGVQMFNMPDFKTPSINKVDCN